MTQDLSAVITALLEPIANEHRYDLVAVEIAGSQGAPCVRVYLDKDGGIDLEAIAAATTWVSDALDEAEPIRGTYTLEVSSPGIDRPLRRLSDFERFIGETAVISVVPPVDGRKRFTGIITGVDGETIALDVDGTEHNLPYGAIVKARLKGRIDFGKEGSGE